MNANPLSSDLMKAQTRDFAVCRRAFSPCSPKQWFYSIDGKPECKGVAACEYLKSLGFSTLEAWAYLRELQGSEEPMQMEPSEERHFDLGES